MPSRTLRFPLQTRSVATFPACGCVDRSPVHGSTMRRSVHLYPSLQFGVSLCAARSHSHSHVFSQISIAKAQGQEAPSGRSASASPIRSSLVAGRIKLFFSPKRSQFPTFANFGWRKMPFCICSEFRIIKHNRQCVWDLRSSLLPNRPLFAFVVRPGTYGPVQPKKDW